MDEKLWFLQTPALEPSPNSNFSYMVILFGTTFQVIVLSPKLSEAHCCPPTHHCWVSPQYPLSRKNTQPVQWPYAKTFRLDSTKSNGIHSPRRNGSLQKEEHRALHKGLLCWPADHVLQACPCTTELTWMFLLPNDIYSCHFEHAAT